MPIYDKSVGLLMREMVSGSQPHQIYTRQQVVAWFQQHYPKIKEGTIAAYLTKLSTNAPSRLHHTVRRGEDDLFFKIDSSHFRLYDPATDPAPIYESTQTNSSDSITGSDETDPFESSNEFAYEKDLQNFLAKNLSLIEMSLRLYEEEGITGLEFPVGGRFIDILALDADNNYVIVELKVSKGYDRVVGQVLRYMAWIKKHHAEPSQQVRGIIVAREISEDLLLACSSIGNIELFEYQLSVSLLKIEK